MEINQNIIVVEWKNGKEKGFTDKQSAERFIKKICEPLNSSFNYQIFEVNEVKL